MFRTSFSRVSSKLNAQHSPVLMLRELHGTCGDCTQHSARTEEPGRTRSLLARGCIRTTIIFCFLRRKKSGEYSSLSTITPSHVKPGKDWVHSKSLVVAHQAHGKGARCHFHLSGAGCDVMEWDEDGIGRDKDRWAPWYCIIFGVSVPANLESVARLALANKAQNPGRYARRAPHRFSGGHSE